MEAGAVRLTRAALDCLLQVDAMTTGSGFFAAPGYVVTCAHVAGATGNHVTLRWQQKELPGTVVAASSEPARGGLWPYPDLAVIRLDDPPKDHPCAWMDDLMPLGGQQLTALGHSNKYRTAAEPVTSLFVYQGDQRFDDGRMFRLKGDELTLGMSGGPVLHMGTGGVCAVVKATRSNNTDMGGLATPIGALRRLDPGVYRALMRAHDNFHAKNCNWPNAVAVDDPLSRRSLSPGMQRVLFGLLAQIQAPGPESLLSAFQDVAGPFASPPELPLYEHRDIISELQAFRQDQGLIPGTLRYAAAVVRDTPGSVGEPLRRHIQAWGGNSDLDGRELAELLRPSNSRSDILRSVMIRVRPSVVDPGLYHVAMWRYNGPQDITPAADEETKALPLDEALAWARELLPGQLLRLGSSPCDAPAMVEMIVPQELMEQEFDRWKPWTHKTWSSLGRKHPVVVRDLERFDDDQLRPYWRARWQRFTNDATPGERPMTLACGYETDQEKLEGWIESHPSLGALVLAGSLHSPASGAVLEVALGCGVPVILWRRPGLSDDPSTAGCPAITARACFGEEEVGTCPAASFFADLSKLVAVDPPSLWPERVRLLRGQAAATPDDQDPRDLVLLWDDPDRCLPESQLRYA